MSKKKDKKEENDKRLANKDFEEKVIVRSIKNEMKQSYMEYAMSVIISRALPDARDGLKPVHRRILYTMHENGLHPSKPYRKAAATVGDVLGKYHPHGDASVYDAIVRLVQDFSMRYPLIDGHGNFGSIDGDAPAAYRYTEIRLDKISEEMIADIEKETVDFMPNYDDRLQEPTVFPTKIPQLLINGSSGIAVGMATNMAPHNLTESIEGIKAYLKNPDIEISELMEHITGPDFPTGGLILGKSAIKEAYETGRGKLKVRGEAEIEDWKNGRFRIVIHSLPYQVNKARLIESIVNYVRDKKIEGISDIRDESDRDAMVRVVIELKREANPNVVLNQLYKFTQLEGTFGIINLALVDGAPKILNLKEIIEIFVKHRLEVIIRRTRFDLAKAEARLHILEGLKIAIDNIDEVIKIIRASYDDPKERLMERFGLSDIQAQAILDMRLKTLSGLQREKIDEEYNKLVKFVAELKAILASEEKQKEIITEELDIIEEKYGDERRTKIIPAEEEIVIEDLIKEEECVITLTNTGYIKRVPTDTYKSQNRGGKGITGLTTKDDDFVKQIFSASTHDKILLFTNKGKMYKLMGYEIPESGRTARGTAVVNLIELDGDESVTAVIPIKEYTKDNYLLMATKNGLVKKTKLTEYETTRKSGLIAIDLNEDDKLISVKKTDGKSKIFLATRKAKFIAFEEEQVRPLGRATKGVRGIKLDPGDYIIGMETSIDDEKTLLTITEKGFGKRTELHEYNLQARGGKGVLTHKLSGKTGDIVGVKLVEGDEDVMLITDEGTIIRLDASKINILGRATKGVTLIKLDKEASVVSFETVKPEEKELEDIQI